MHERENILRIFEETKKAVELGDAAKIKNLSNQTTNTAALTHDPDNIAAAVIVYSLSKIIERENYKLLPGWKKFYQIYIVAINDIINAIRKKDDESYRKNIEIINSAIGKISGKLKQYIKDVFRKAKINKASKIYEHGMSMEKTARLLGITLFELASYVGEKGISEIPESKTMNVQKRVKLAMEMFE